MTQGKHHSPRQMLAQKPVPRHCWARQRLWRLQRQRRPPGHCCHWSGLWQRPAADKNVINVRLLAVKGPHSHRLCAHVWASTCRPSAGGNMWARNFEATSPVAQASSPGPHSAACTAAALGLATGSCLHASCNPIMTSCWNKTPSMH